MLSRLVSTDQLTGPARSATRLPSSTRSSSDRLPGPARNLSSRAAGSGERLSCLQPQEEAADRPVLPPGESARKADEGSADDRSRSVRHPLSPPGEGARKADEG